MKIRYCQHALRDMGDEPTQVDGIKKLGVKDSKIVAEIMTEGQNKEFNIKAIYSSPFKRCMETAKIINSKLNVTIIEDPRFNEFNVETSIKGETWVELQQRVRNAIKDIVFTYNENDAVICVTSGVNIAAFISLAYNLQPNKSAPFIGVSSCSPMIFDIKKENF